MDKSNLEGARKIRQPLYKNLLRIRAVLWVFQAREDRIHLHQTNGALHVCHQVNLLSISYMIACIQRLSMHLTRIRRDTGFNQDCHRLADIPKVHLQAEWIGQGLDLANGHEDRCHHAEYHCLRNYHKSPVDPVNPLNLVNPLRTLLTVGAKLGVGTCVGEILADCIVLTGNEASLGQLLPTTTLRRSLSANKVEKIYKKVNNVGSFHLVSDTPTSFHTVKHNLKFFQQRNTFRLEASTAFNDFNQR